MKNKKNISIIILVLLILIASIWYWKSQNNEEQVIAAKVVDNIEKYGYSLYENKTALYKDLFGELKEKLNQEPVEEKVYAELIAKLFVVDFYTLDNKVTNTDIGGLDFIHKEGRETFLLAAKDTIYKYVENNVYGKRNQQLPEVKEVTITKNEKTTYEKDTIKDENAYRITVDITYQKELEYPKSVELILIHDNNKLYIVEVK